MVLEAVVVVALWRTGKSKVFHFGSATCMTNPAMHCRHSTGLENAMEQKHENMKWNVILTKDENFQW